MTLRVQWAHEQVSTLGKSCAVSVLWRECLLRTIYYSCIALFFFFFYLWAVRCFENESSVSSSCEQDFAVLTALYFIWSIWFLQDAKFFFYLMNFLAEMIKVIWDFSCVVCSTDFLVGLLFHQVMFSILHRKRLSHFQ